MAHKSFVKKLMIIAWWHKCLMTVEHQDRGTLCGLVSSLLHMSMKSTILIVEKKEWHTLPRTGIE